MSATVHSLIAELESALPHGADLDAAKQHAIFGGPVGKVLALIAALQAGDNKAAWTAFKELGDMLLGIGSSTPGGISFAPQAGLLQNIDWTRIIGILTKLLPLILAA